MGETVRGASHERTGLPNQDAIGFVPLNGSGPGALLAISDGHGSSRSFRSDVGAALAVKIALESLRPILSSKTRVSVSALKHSVTEQLPRDIAKRWRLAVEDHLKANPLSADEQLKTAPGNCFLPYGATLLAVALTERYQIYLQIGDGDIVRVSDEGAASRVFARDSQLLGNETTSLCMPEAWREIKTEFLLASYALPALVAVSTDGYSNSFLDEAAFLRVGPDILEMINSNGIDTVAQTLKDWLEEASRMGSGDDITLGLICRSEGGPGALWSRMKKPRRPTEA